MDDRFRGETRIIQQWAAGEISSNHIQSKGEKTMENHGVLWDFMGFHGISWHFIVIQWDINGIYPLVKRLHNYGKITIFDGNINYK